jgi:hypothetical protein
MPFGEPSIPASFIQETLHKHERRLSDLERQQLYVVYDPSNNTGDSVGRTVVIGNLWPICGIDAFGIALYDEHSSSWQQVGLLGIPRLATTVLTTGFPQSFNTAPGRFSRVSAGSYTMAITGTFSASDAPEQFGIQMVANATGQFCRVMAPFTIPVTLAAFPAYGDGTIHLTSTAGLQSSGLFRLLQAVGYAQALTYTGIAGNDLTGVTGWQGPAPWGGGPALEAYCSDYFFDYVGGPQVYDLGLVAPESAIFQSIPGQKVWTRVT